MTHTLCYFFRLLLRLNHGKLNGQTTSTARRLFGVHTTVRSLGRRGSALSKRTNEYQLLSFEESQTRLLAVEHDALLGPGWDSGLETDNPDEHGGHVDHTQPRRNVRLRFHFFGVPVQSRKVAKQNKLPQGKVRRPRGWGGGGV